ncbi:hypothetical protein QM637_15650 [Pantoea allii]|uniref:hypothetical protein n=1 Tax=Pantoea allii TaxID=574096 RepID=UPI0024B6C74F|nr:hypothetical protein [Pantoea allii]MDJ0037254.1 hypothetical protein [Pantoea allii]MDJ0088265.1 hypothetical protein [Pantoea allii]
MNLNEAIKILTELIVLSATNKSNQGQDLYKSALGILKNASCTDTEVKSLYRSFCGYLAHGEFNDEEYLKVLQLIGFLES